MMRRRKATCGEKVMIHCILGAMAIFGLLWFLSNLVEETTWSTTAGVVTALDQKEGNCESKDGCHIVFSPVVMFRPAGASKKFTFTSWAEAENQNFYSGGSTVQVLCGLLYPSNAELKDEVPKSMQTITNQ